VLNKKFHTVFFGLSVLVAAISVALLFIDRKADIDDTAVYLFGIHVKILRGIFTILLFLMLFFLQFIVVISAKATLRVKLLLFSFNHKKAKKLLDKYYPKNDLLFFDDLLFYALSIGDQKILEDLFARYNKDKYKGKSLSVKTYRFLYDYITGQKNETDLSRLIKAHRRRTNTDFIILLCAIEHLKNSRYQEAIEQANQFPIYYYYPVYAIIISKIKFSAQKELGLDFTETLYRAERFAYNDFLSSSYKKLI
jgi:hypothetical protein